MRVLVTGGAGYIGSHTAKVLAQKGYEPVVFDNLSTGHGWAVKWGPLVKGELENGQLVREVLTTHQIEAVIHFAANAYVGESMQNPRKYFRNNVIASLNLLEAMQDVGVNQIVFSSTCATYGDPQSLPLTESHPLQPVNPYGDSKLFVERALGWFDQAYNFKHVSLRYFNASGADPEGEIGEWHEPETHLIPLVLQTALGLRSHLEVFGTDYDTPDGTAVRDYIHVTDLATAHVQALIYLKNGGASSAFNLGTGKGHSVAEVIRAAEHCTGITIHTRETVRRPGDPPVLVADAQKAASVLNWQPQLTTLDEILRTAWEWHRKCDV